MTKRKHSIARKVGQPPGILLHIGQTFDEEAKIAVLDYDAEAAHERPASRPEDLAPFRSSPSVTWISINGLHNVDLIEKIGAAFAIHPLVLEDILNTNQRPKLEDYGDYLYIVLQAFAGQAEGAVSEQVSLIIGANYVISFEESHRDIFSHVRERINTCKGRIRREGADYLAYSLIDTIVDNYFVVLEAMGEQLEELEETLVVQPGQETLQAIHVLKREMLMFRKALWPLREIIGALSRGESPLVKQSTLLYLRDVYDHTIQVIDTLETYRDILSGLLDIYLSSISNRLNQIMKVLALISTIFMPLTFIAGLYGMNFRYMPELEWDWGYPAVLGLMFIVAMMMVRYFQTRKWL